MNWEYAKATTFQQKSRQQPKATNWSSIQHENVVFIYDDDYNGWLFNV